MATVWGDGWEGQLGLEPTWQEYIAHLLECAREWWRVLKPTGNLFVNIGDTFAGSHGQGNQARDKDSYLMPYPQAKSEVPKMKLGIPYRLRFALNDMGWVSRDDIIWYKGKRYPDGKITKVAMPESVKDRMSCSYEMLFHFVKEPKGYWFDLDAVRRPHLPVSLARYKRGVNLVERTGAAMTPANKFWDKEDLERHGGAGTLRGRSYKRAQNPSGELQRSPATVADEGGHPAGANPGDVWIIQPEPFKEAHYAVWPSKLCERMIKVGCPKEVCPKCGKPRERITSVEYKKQKYSHCRHQGYHAKGDAQGMVDMSAYPRMDKVTHTIGWSDCGCGEGWVNGVVLDPFFGGSGRIARVALYLGRNIIGVDMKEDYLEMAKRPLLQGVLL